MGSHHWADPRIAGLSGSIRGLVKKAEDRGYRNGVERFREVALVIVDEAFGSSIKERERSHALRMKLHKLLEDDDV